MATDVRVALIGDDDSLRAAINRSSTALNRFGQQSGRVMTSTQQSVRRTQTGFRNFGSNVASVLAGIGIVQFFRGAIDEAAEAQRVMAQTNAVIQSTGGVAGITAGHVEELAETLSELAAVDDEIIQQGANLLLTFKNIRGEATFDAALASALDLSRAMGTDLQGSVIMVGKALNDPVAGLGRLARAGVDFSDAQKAAIEQMVAFGNVAGAQEIILAELESQFGGAAEANRTAADEMQVAWDNLKEAVGEALIPVLEDLVPILQSIVDAFEGMPASVQAATIAVFGLVIAVGALNAVGGLTVLKYAGWAVLGTIFSALTLVVIPLGIALLALAPILGGLAVIAGVAYGAFLLVRAALDRVSQGLGGVRGNAISAGDAIKGLAGIGLDALLGALRAGRDLLGSVSSVGKGTTSVISSLGNLALGGLRGALNGILSLLRSAASAADRLMSALRGAQGLAGGVSGAIPGNATGSFAFPGGWTIAGENGAELIRLPSGSRIFDNHESGRMARGGGSGGGGGRVLNVHIHAPIGRERDLERWLVDTIRRAEREAS